MLGFLPICMNFIFGTLLTANGNLKALNFISLGGIIANVCINLWLIPKHGALGAAIATFFTQLVTAILQFCYCVLKFKIPLKIIGFLKFATLIGGLFSISHYFNNSDYLILLQLIVGFLLTFSLSLIDLNSMKELYFSSRRIK